MLKFKQRRLEVLNPNFVDAKILKSKQTKAGLKSLRKYKCYKYNSFPHTHIDFQI